MMTFCPPRDSKIEGRNRLSCGSAEVQTLQRQASEGTPIDVPEPRIVTFMGSEAIRSQLLRWRATLNSDKNLISARPPSNAISVSLP
jgi:hypothetical protein